MLKAALLQPPQLQPNRLGGIAPRLAIIGNYPQDDPVVADEIWVFNGKGASLPKYDIVFQMHQPCDWGGEWSKRWLLENKTTPVYMREYYDEVPMAVRYPFEDVLGMLGKLYLKDKPLQYFTSTICWAIALATFQDRPLIDIYGIEMADKEYEDQKDCFAFWVGFAGGRGLEINLHCASGVFDKPLYGAQPLEK